MSAARWVITLPPTLQGKDALAFAQKAKEQGAQWLELRTDLHGADSADAAALAQVLPLIVSEREIPLSEAWLAAAQRVDVPVEESEEKASPRSLLSHHAAQPLSTAEVLALWDIALPEGAWLKHVEPLGSPERFSELLQTQEALRARFGAHRVTVLCMGPLALPFRSILAERNALDYVALGSGWSAAPGQRLLADVKREGSEKGRARRGILGTQITHSRSPRIHTQPFDRIDLPEQSPVESVVKALLPFYKGFAVTSPFKQPLAKLVNSPLEAVNTLVRRKDHWEGFNTDVDGAREVLRRMKAQSLFVLGGGGATAALRLAAKDEGVDLTVLRQADIGDPLRGPGIWTWPDRVVPPETLRFDGAEVAVIAYGVPGRKIAAEILRRGGRPRMLGAAWFIAQARQQRAFWETAT